MVQNVLMLSKLFRFHNGWEARCTWPNMRRVFPNIVRICWITQRWSRIYLEYNTSEREVTFSFALVCMSPSKSSPLCKGSIFDTSQLSRRVLNSEAPDAVPDYRSGGHKHRWPCASCSRKRQLHKGHHWLWSSCVESFWACETQRKQDGACGGTRGSCKLHRVPHPQVIPDFVLSQAWNHVNQIPPNMGVFEDYRKWLACFKCNHAIPVSRKCEGICRVCSSKLLMIPFPVGSDLNSALTSNQGEWMLIDRTSISMDGEILQDQQLLNRNYNSLAKPGKQMLDELRVPRMKHWEI